MKDTFCGQIVNSRQFKRKFKIAKILTEVLPVIEEAELHKRNPVKTCEYARNKRIFGAEILRVTAWQYLRQITNKKDRVCDISGIIILEDQILERKTNIREGETEIGENCLYYRGYQKQLCRRNCQGRGGNYNYKQLLCRLQGGVRFISNNAD